jgi:hypothetical protein
MKEHAMTTNNIEQAEYPRLLLTVQQTAARLRIGPTPSNDLIATGDRLLARDHGGRHD